ncbi:MAG: iron ABC transporter permease [Kineosporiaceae bacterium]
MTAVPVTARVPRGGRPGLALAVAALALLVAVAIGTTTGALHLPLGPTLLTLLDRLPGVHLDGGLDRLQATVLLEIRLPRVLLAAVVGGMLATAGAGYQGVFRNPLADPYLLGAAAGAGLGATLVIAYSPVRQLGPVGMVPLAAFAGALGGVALASVLGALSTRAGGAGNGATLLLAGVAVASFLTAAQTLVQQGHAENLREVYSWLLGQLGTSSWDQLGLIAPYVVVSAAVLIACGRLLDVLAVGDDEASALGLRPARVRLLVLFAASLGTAAAVASAGLIGFVGLVVPHVVRRLAGTSYRIVLPVSLLGGAAFLVLADVVARSVLAPAELPIGVVTAFVGAPFFAALLRLGSSS